MSCGFLNPNPNPNPNPKRKPNLHGIVDLRMTCPIQMGVPNEKVLEGAILVQCHAPLGMPFSGLVSEDV